jgi:multidrug efflux pump
MARFFIDRPIFAWVIALFIIVGGAVSITQLPVAQYPTVAPPAIVVTVVYPGASARTLEDNVLTVIEQEMNGSPGLIYMESVAQANGSGTLTLTFSPNTNPDLAQVDVQNRLSRASPRLPSAVTQQGVRVDKSRSNFLLFTILTSSDPAYTPVALGDYAARNVKIGGATGSQWIVLEGLKAGEQVIVEGFQKMRPGAPVKPVPWTGAAARPAPAAASAPASAASR